MGMIGVIADDLTGAAELGAMGLRRGLRAGVITSCEASANADLVCIDTDSRSCDSHEAAERATAAARWLQKAGAEWIYKKTDSLLRGNVAAEIEAIRKELRLRGALLIPANPSLGRTVVDGQYFAHGRLIHETEFARDPKHPRTSPRVLDLLQAPDGVGTAVRNFAQPMPDSGIVVGEVANGEDLRRWAAKRPKDFLMAGGAEFFHALLPAGTERPMAVPSLSGLQLFVCGSASEATRSFVAAQAEMNVPVLSLPSRIAETGLIQPADLDHLAQQAVRELASNQRVIIQVGLPLVQDTQIAGRLALELVQIAERVLRSIEVSHVFAEGGATAVALVNRMRWGRLTVVSELAQGVAMLSPAIGNAPHLIIKPGSYTWPDSILRPS